MKNKMSYFYAVLALIVAAGLLYKSQPVADGVIVGLQNCTRILIPSLFPFLILAGIISSTSTGKALSHAVSHIVLPLTGMPEKFGSVFLMSFLGGYPVGARMLSSMLRGNEITSKSAERALCCCVNAGPSFLITAIGAGMLGSRPAGFTLLIAQVLSSFCLAIYQFRFSARHESIKSTPANVTYLKTGAAETFVTSVRESTSGMIGICSFVVAFCAITSLLRSFGIIGFLAHFLGTLIPKLGDNFFDAALTGILEVTGGCISAAALHTREGFLLCAFLVSFSSFSIIFQIRSCFSPDIKLHFGSFFCSRLIHGLISTVFAAVGWHFLPPDVLISATISGVPIAPATPSMFITTICLIAMISMLLITPKTYDHKPR